MLISSGYNFEGYRIVEYLDFCSGECVLGTGFLSSMGAGFADFFGTTSSTYADKLAKAKSYAIANLKTQAKNYGANAIIGVDVDYTTFTADVMGVVANGTAVRVEKISASGNLADNEIVERVVNLPVINYYDSMDFRTLNCYYNADKRKISLELITYKSSVIVQALNVDIIANSIFGTEYKYEDINFTNCDLQGGLIKTEEVNLDISENVLKAINSISIKLNKCLVSGEIYSPDKEYKISNMELSKLIEFRKLYGNDLFEDFHDDADSWVCMCGNKNANNIDKCKRCGRGNRAYSKVVIVKDTGLEQVLPALLSQENCTDIYHYMCNVEQENGVHYPEELMAELRRLIKLERFGNMKEKAIDQIREYL